MASASELLQQNLTAGGLDLQAQASKASVAPGLNADTVGYGLSSSAPSVLASAPINGNSVNNSDFNADGKADILWRNYATGDNAVWLMDGTALSSSAYLAQTPDLNWESGLNDAFTPKSINLF